MDGINSSLALQKLVFDEIQFNRKGFKNNNELVYGIQVQIGVNEEESEYKVTLILTADKRDEYNIRISLSGFFQIVDQANLDDKLVRNLINKNAVAIMMPYVRSELTLLTAQPDTENIVLPPFDINKMLEKS